MTTTSAFHVGARVLLAVPDRFIQDRHGVTPDETVGRIVGRQGEKWVVNWGILDFDAHCEEFQLEPAPAEPAAEPEVESEPEPGPAPARSQILIDCNMGMTFLVANDKDRNPAEFEQEAAASHLEWATPVARGQVYTPDLAAADFTDLAGQALGAGYTFQLHVEYPGADPTFLTLLLAHLDTLIQTGRHERAATILDAHGAEVTKITVTRQDTPAVITRRGGYIGTTDNAFREVFLPRWARVYPDQRSRGGRLLRKTRAALAAGKGAFVEI